MVRHDDLLVTPNGSDNENTNCTVLYFFYCGVDNASSRDCLWGTRREDSSRIRGVFIFSVRVDGVGKISV